MGKYHLGGTDGYNPIGAGLPKFLVGSPVSVNNFQAITRGIDRATVTSGYGYQVRRYSNSTVIQPNQYVVGAPSRNFQIFGFTDSNGNGFATSTIGTVNRTIPKISGLYLDQVDAEKKIPKVPVTGDGYIIIEAYYDEFKPFPDGCVIKFVPALDANQFASDKSEYPLASVKYTPASLVKNEPAQVSITQIHEGKNLACCRVKVGASRIYWQWWTV